MPDVQRIAERFCTGALPSGRHALPASINLIALLRRLLPQQPFACAYPPRALEVVSLVADRTRARNADPWAGTGEEHAREREKYEARARARSLLRGAAACGQVVREGDVALPLRVVPGEQLKRRGVSTPHADCAHNRDVSAFITLFEIRQRIIIIPKLSPAKCARWLAIAAVPRP